MLKQGPHSARFLFRCNFTLTKVVGINRLEIIYYAIYGYYLCMVRAGRSKPVRGVVNIEKMTLAGQLFIHGFGHDHHTEVRAIDLVEGKQVNISAERFNVRQAVARIGNPVNNSQGACRVYLVRQCSYRVDAANNV